MISGNVIASKLLDNGTEVDDNVSCLLPSVEVPTAEVKGAGILGSIDWPVFGQVNAMAFTINMRSINKKSANLAKPGTHDLELRFARDTMTSGGQVVPEGAKIFIVASLRNTIRVK